MAVLLISLFFLFFAFSLGQITRIEIIPSVAITALDVVVACFFAYLAITVFTRRNIKISPTWKSFCLFIAFTTGSLLINSFSLPSNQLLAASLYLFRYIVYAGMFFLFFTFSPVQKQVAKYFMTGGGLLIVVIGYVQFFLYPSLRNLYYAGWDEHLYRMFGSFLDPNFLGIFLVVFSLFLVYQVVISTNRIGKYVYGFMLIAAMGGVFLTYSRSALISLLISGTMFFLLLGKKRIVGIFWAIILIAGLVTFLISGKRSEGTNFLRVVSTEARLESVTEALTIWQKNPILGVGFNTYRYAQYKNGFLNKKEWEESHAAAGTDNSFLFVAATTGIVGLVAFLYFLYTHISVLLHQKRMLDRALGIGSFVAVCVGSLFVNALFYPSIMLWLWIVLAFTESM